MRYIAALMLMLVACGDETYAGGVGAGGASSAAGTGGDMATAGSAGTTGTGGGAGATDAGSDTFDRSCLIPIAQVSGTDEAATWIRRSGAACTSTSQMIRAQVVDGALYNFFDAAEWTVDNVSATKRAGDVCALEVRFRRVNGSCDDLLFVHVTVPAI